MAANARTAPLRPGIRWDRVGRMALLGVLCGIVLLYVTPIVHWVQQSRTASAERADLHDLQRENARLKARAAQLARPDAVDREARRLGMVKSGEREFVIENLPRR